jgi:hypothetical protein
MLDSKYDYTHEDIARTNQRMQKFKCEGILGVTKDLNISNLCLWEQEHSCKQQIREMHSLYMPF